MFAVIFVDIHAIGAWSWKFWCSAKEIRNKIKKPQMNQVKRIIDKLEATPEADGSIPGRIYQTIYAPVILFN